MVKKLIYRTLCNRFTGAVIRALYKDTVPSVRWRGFRFNLARKETSNTILASIFWGFYESAEVRLVRKYFRGDVDAVEFGSSSGVVSAQIVSRYSVAGRRYLGVEANAYLKDAWLKNVQRHAITAVDTQLVHAAVYYDAEAVSFQISNNPTASGISGTPSSSLANVITATTLTKVIEKYSLTDYALFCDIEGAEAAMLLSEQEAFVRCRYLFIELHETVYHGKDYNVNDLIALIESKGFELIEKLGAVCYFEKR